MKITAAITALSIGLAMAANAQETSEGRDLAKLSFATVDQNENGYIDMGESHLFGEDVFISMDADENELLSQEEFLDWGYGFQTLAEDSDKELAYRTALIVVFSFWDRDGDGNVSRAEQRRAVIGDFQRADLNSDGLMDESEFFGGFSVMVATRAALKPEVN